jgi:hypothetical protein
MFCKNCGKQVEDRVRFCKHCGEETGYTGNGEGPYTEPKSSIQGAGDPHFFGKEERGSQDNELSTRTALILAVLFGPFGGHCFYTGHIAIGVAKIGLSLTVLGLIYYSFAAWTLGALGWIIALLLADAVWYIIDLVMIHNGEYRDKQGRKLYHNY